MAKFGRVTLVQLFKGILKAVALNGPVAWVGWWSHRARHAHMSEVFGGQSSVRDFLPWGPIREIPGAYENSTTQQP